MASEIGSGRFDKLARRMLMAARGALGETAIGKIVATDLRSRRSGHAGVGAERLGRRREPIPPFPPPGRGPRPLPGS